MVTNAMNEGSDVGLYFLDFTKAFDVVNYRTFWAKFTAVAVIDHLVTYIRSLLAAKTFQVRIGNAMSNVRLAANSVPQASAIGLF